MKKNILKVAFVAAFALVAGYSVYTAKAQTNLSDLALDNVEALASGEGDTTCLGCYFTSFLVCRTMGDWGACCGEWDHYTYWA